MDDRKSMQKYLQTSPVFEISTHLSYSHYAKDCVAFTGTPRKHPYDAKKIILISDPFSTNTVFFEFKIDDVVHMEELTNIVTESGESVILVKVWVRRGSLGVRYEPFVVEDTLHYLQDNAVLD